MLLIEGREIPAFDPRIIFRNNVSITTDKHVNLCHSIARSRVYRDGHNYLIGESLPLKTEYYEYANNTLIVCEKENTFTYIIVLHGNVFAVTSDIEDAEIKKFFATHEFMVIDSYGKEIWTHSYEEFVNFIESASKLRESYNIKLEKYHNFMKEIYDFRNCKETALNCYVSESYDKLLSLSNDFAKEMIDLLYAYNESIEKQIVDKFIHTPNDQEKNCIIFGLYIASLRAYKLNYNFDSMSLDERLYKSFMREFNLFLAEHEDILDMYCTYFSQRKCEYDEIKRMLVEENLDGTEWDTHAAEISIL